MEERIIKVSLEKAKEWYKSFDNTLKELALQAFSREELEILSFESIICKLFNSKYLDNLTPIQKEQLHSIYKRKDFSKVSAPKILRIIAQYFNNGWKKEIGNTGYFFTKIDSNYGMCVPNETLGNDWDIIKHEWVCYPITYFKTEADCKKAFEILKNMNKLDNLYTDF